MNEKGFFRTEQTQTIALDSAVCEVNAEEGLVAVHRCRDIFCGRGILGVNNALTGTGIAVGKVKVDRVNKGGQTGCIGSFITAVDRCRKIQ